jgi:sugar phosphate isomerase/epimerase
MLGPETVHAPGRSSLTPTDSMKLAVITDEITQEFERALDVMCEFDVTGAELRGLWGTNVADLDASQVARARQALADRDMHVVCLATPMFKCDLRSDESEILGRMHLAKARGLSEQNELLRRCCGLAHQFGTDLIRVFTFWRKSELTPQIEEQIVDAFAEPVKIAEEEGVTLVLENEHACFIGTGSEAARVLSAIDSPRVRAVWDPGNALFAGEEPYPAGYAEIQPFVRHVHIKDAITDRETGTLRWCVVGEGDIDYAGQFEALHRDGYAGYISLETHYIPEGGTPEEGSRACLAGLRRFIKD